MFEENLKSIIDVLEEKEFDALLLTSPQNRFYATGFNSSDGVALICRDKSVFATDFRYYEDACSKISGFGMVMTSRNHGYYDIINDFCAQLGIKSLGFEDNAVNVAEFSVMKEKLNAELMPIGDMMTRLRLVKKPFEIELIENSQRIAEKAFVRLMPSIKAGVSESDLAAELDYLMRTFGAEKCAFDTICVSGENGSLCHGVPGGRIIQPGDFITFDFGAFAGGYCSDMTRTVAVGYVSDEMRKVYDVVLQAQLAALDAAKAGIIGSDLHNIAAKVIGDAGYGEYFGHGLGHSVGIEVHDGPGASPTNPNPLPAGTVVTIEPGIYIAGKFGVRIEDFVVLTEDGCRNLTRTEKELKIL